MIRILRKFSFNHAKIRRKESEAKISKTSVKFIHAQESTVLKS
jgi:hypothetical protein